MLELQDQKIMHDYFSDLLFKPLVEDLDNIEDQKELENAEVNQAPVKEEKPNTRVELDLLPLPSERELRTRADVIVEPTPVPVAENRKLTTNSGLADAETELEQEQDQEIETPWADYQWSNGRPPWAQQQFDCLLFEVCGFHFAVPLITLGQIQAITDDLTPVFGQAPWFMGIQNTAIGSQRVVNTALFVMPERYKPDKTYKPPYMISIADCPWALAVDKVNQPISLTPDDVKWRVQREKQTWLAGVVKKQMCVLIDVPELARQLLKMEKH